LRVFLKSKNARKFEWLKLDQNLEYPLHKKGASEKNLPVRCFDLEVFETNCKIKAMPKENHL